MDEDERWDAEGVGAAFDSAFSDKRCGLARRGPKVGNLHCPAASWWDRATDELPFLPSPLLRDLAQNLRSQGLFNAGAPLTPARPKRLHPASSTGNRLHHLCFSNIPLPRPLEKEPHHKYLQPRHGDHEHILNDAEPEDARLGAADGAEIAVLARAEVLLVPRDGRQLPGELEHGLGEEGGLLGGGALFGGEGGAVFVFDLDVCFVSTVDRWRGVGVSSLPLPTSYHRSSTGTHRNLKIHHLLTRRAHPIIKAKAVLAHLIRREDEITLPLLRTVEHELPIGRLDGVVDVEGAAGLDGEVEGGLRVRLVTSLVRGW